MNAPIKKIEREIAEWVKNQRNKSRMLEGPMEKIRSALGSTDRQPGYLASQLECLSTWYMMDGANEILSDDPSGWTKLDLGLKAVFWSKRILRKKFEEMSTSDRLNWTWTTLNSASQCYGSALALGRFDLAEWIASNVISGLDDGSFNFEGLTPFEAFVSLLQSKLDGKQSKAAVAGKAGVYREIVDRWDNISPDVITRICDYHLKCATGPSSDEFSDFEEDPYRIFPIDILSIYNVRRSIGKDTPTIRHPLLETNLANPPPSISTFQNEIANRAIDYAMSVVR